MATVLDSFVVEVGLDPRKFVEGDRAVQQAYKRSQDQIVDLGKNVEREGAKLSDIFGLLRKSAIGFVGAFVGEEAAGFMNKIVQMDASTGRLAKTIGLSVQGLSTWQGIVRQVGGSAESATATLSAMADAFNQVQAGAGFFSGPFATLLNRAGVARGANPDQTLRQITAYLSAEQASGRMTPQMARFWAQQIPGINQDMINVILSGADALRRYETAARAAGTATEGTAAISKDFQEQLGILEVSLENVGRAVLRAVNEGPTHGKPFFEWFFGLPSVGLAQGSPLDKIKNWITDPRPRSFRDLWNDLKGGDGEPSSGTTGSSRGDRNNNPGNIEYGGFALSQGAIGSDGRFAVFPSLTVGNKAMATLLNKNYQGLTLAEIQRKWVGNSDPGYLRSMMSATGLGAGDRPNLDDPNVVAALMTGMSRGEGTHLTGAHAAAAIGAGRAGGGTGLGRGDVNSTTTVNVQEINVTSSKADPKEVADEIPSAFGRVGLATPANYGQN